MEYDLPLMPDKGNYLYIIKPTDMALPEGKVLLKPPNLDILVYGVEGHIEVVPYFNNIFGRSCVAFCNEEGKLQGKLPNLYAQHLWEEAVGRPITEDHLVGNIVVVVGTASFLGRM